MNYKDLITFKETVADPVSKAVFDAIQIPDGFCCIDNMSICYLDGRSCGVDSLIQASGLVFKDGTVEEYTYSQQDVSFEDFVQSQSGHVFLADGILQFADELEELEVKTNIFGFRHLVKLREDLGAYQKLRLSSCFSEHFTWYQKMKHLMTVQKAPDRN